MCAFSWFGSEKFSFYLRKCARIINAKASFSTLRFFAYIWLSPTVVFPFPEIKRKSSQKSVFSIQILFIPFESTRRRTCVYYFIHLCSSCVKYKFIVLNPHQRINFRKNKRKPKTTVQCLSICLHKTKAKNNFRDFTTLHIRDVYGIVCL